MKNYLGGIYMLKSIVKNVLRSEADKRLSDIQKGVLEALTTIIKK